MLIGQNHKQRKVVGYFNCTHLHAPEGKSDLTTGQSHELLTVKIMPSNVCCCSGEGAIRCEQMNMVTKWISEFQAATGRADEDVVFDVLCGDFNFDNCSPGVWT